MTFDTENVKAAVRHGLGGPLTDVLDIDTGPDISLED